MLIGRFLGAVGNDFVIGIAVDDGFHLSFIGGALAAETHPNGKRIRKLADGGVEGTFGALRIVVIV